MKKNILIIILTISFVSVSFHSFRQDNNEPVPHTRHAIKSVRQL